MFALASLSVFVFTFGMRLHPKAFRDDALSYLFPPIQILWRVEREGERLEKPPDCPQELYAVMRRCWMCNPNDRPNFTQLGTLVAEVGGSTC